VKDRLVGEVGKKVLGSTLTFTANVKFAAFIYAFSDIFTVLFFFLSIFFSFSFSFPCGQDS
jgi:hypothetical protein